MEIFLGPSNVYVLNITMLMVYNVHYYSWYPHLVTENFYCKWKKDRNFNIRELNRRKIRLRFVHMDDTYVCTCIYLCVSYDFYLFLWVTLYNYFVVVLIGTFKPEVVSVNGPNDYDHDITLIKLGFKQFLSLCWSPSLSSNVCR